MWEVPSGWKIGEPSTSTVEHRCPASNYLKPQFPLKPLEPRVERMLLPDNYLNKKKWWFCGALGHLPLFSPPVFSFHTPRPRICSLQGIQTETSQFGPIRQETSLMEMGLTNCEPISGRCLAIPRSGGSLVSGAGPDPRLRSVLLNPEAANCSTTRKAKMFGNKASSKGFRNRGQRPEMTKKKKRGGFP